MTNFFISGYSLEIFHTFMTSLQLYIISDLVGTNYAKQMSLFSSDSISLGFLSRPVVSLAAFTVYYNVQVHHGFSSDRSVGYLYERHVPYGFLKLETQPLSSDNCSNL